MTLEDVAKFKRKLTCHLKNDIRNLVNFHASSRKSENLHFDWILLFKTYKDLDQKVLKSYVSWHWRVVQSLKKYWLLLSKMTWGIWWILMQVAASLKICTLMCYFCLWHIKFHLKKYKRIISNSTEKNIQTLKKNWLFIWKNDKKNLVNFNLSSKNSENLYFDELLL